MSEIFFNDFLIGGLEELETLDKQGKLDSLIQECLNGLKHVAMATKLF